MTRKTTAIPLASSDRIIKNAGAERTADSASIALSKILEEYGTKVSIDAIVLAKHAGRSTIRDEDIKLAAEELAKSSK